MHIESMGRYRSGWTGGPVSKHFPERRAAEMVREGVLRLDPDGSVWRLKKINYGLDGTVVATTPLKTPRRIDHGPPGAHRSFKITSTRDTLTSVSVARFIWQVNFGDIPERLTVNHKDGKPDNNVPENYELLTHSEQHKHRFAVLGHISPGKTNKRLTKTFAEAARIALASGDLEPLRAALEAFDARPFGRLAQYRDAKAEREGRS